MRMADSEPPKREWAWVVPAELADWEAPKVMKPHARLVLGALVDRERETLSVFFLLGGCRMETVEVTKAALTDDRRRNFMAHWNSPLSIRDHGITLAFGDFEFDIEVFLDLKKAQEASF